MVLRFAVRGIDNVITFEAIRVTKVPGAIPAPETNIPTRIEVLLFTVIVEAPEVPVAVFVNGLSIVIPDTAISAPRESPCGTLVCTVIALPTGRTGKVKAPPILELVNGAAEYIAVLLASLIAVIVESLFIDLAL